MHTDPISAFTGLKIVEPKPKDWIRGQETGLEAAMVPNDDWGPFLPTPKSQLIVVDGVVHGDTESCTNFSITNDAATYLNWLHQSGKLPPEHEQWLRDNGYFDADGLINLSPRFSAITSGTTGEEGNSLPNVWEALRTKGAVPLADCDFPIAEWRAKIATGSFKLEDLWAIWFDPAAAANALAKGAQFVKLFQTQYHWLAFANAPATMQQLHDDLGTGPAQLAIEACVGWNNEDPIQGCGVNAGHAVELYWVEPATYDILDHYQPFKKQLAANYGIPYAMQGILVPIVDTPVTYPPPPGFKHTFTTSLDLGTTSAEVIALQNALKADGDFPLTVQSTGYFGPITQTAVQKFQAKYGIVSSGTPTTTGYGRVGPKTMAKLNQLFS